MATFLLRNHDAIVVSSGKNADIAYLLDQPKIVVFDIARDAMEHVNFGVMECIKNGRIFSPKYESAIKAFDIPHLVVFANAPCPHGKFSEDRLKQVNLSTWRPRAQRPVGITMQQAARMNAVDELVNGAFAHGFIPPVLTRQPPVEIGVIGDGLLEMPDITGMDGLPNLFPDIDYLNMEDINFNDLFNE